MSNREGYNDPTAETAIANVMLEQFRKKREPLTYHPTIPKKEVKDLETVPQLKRVTRIDSIPAGSTYFNEQGFLHDTPIVTSTGIFEYALPDGGVRRELRLPEHVFDKESLASYEGKPVIITHNAGSIDKTNVMQEIVGTILSNGYRDGNDVRCKIVIHDIDKVKKIPYRELSLGYSLDLIEEPGEWNGEPYDAIQTNIRINHLAIVETARAGDQAHLNLDGKKVELDDIQNLEEGGNNTMPEMHGDNLDLTPEELVEAIKSYKASKAEPTVEEPVAQPDAAEEKVEGNENGTDVPTEVPVEEPVAPVVAEEPTPAEPVAEKKDDDTASIVISALEQLLATLKGGNTAQPVCDNADVADVPCDAPISNDDNADNGDNADNADNSDSSDDMSQSMNNDSADDIIRQRLEICRMGDKLNMDGLESKSILDGKKAIIEKVLPNMRLDGKDATYIDAAYDIAVGEITKRKGVDYQRQQMSANPVERVDSAENCSMASSSRQKMLEREGGNK